MSAEQQSIMVVFGFAFVLGWLLGAGIFAVAAWAIID
jgi:hypothetical protein